MYTKWAVKQGFKGRLVDIDCSAGSGLKSATIDLEWQFAYGYLAGERGIHRMIGSFSETIREVPLGIASRSVCLTSFPSQYDAIVYLLYCALC